jgi:hypothetical protein
MKTLLSLLFIAFAASLSAQDIPNASFENWVPYANGEYPSSWTTSDSISYNYNGGNNVTKGTDPYDGSFSMHLKSVQIQVGPFQVTGPGIATNGLINFNSSTFTFEFSGGSPDTVRSRFLVGSFKYAPTNTNDSGFIRVILLKDSVGIKDTIAQGMSMFAGNVGSYTPFSTILYYNDYRRQPDTCLIIIQSSKGINDPNIGIGTELVVDSLGFEGTVGVNELSDAITNVNIFPTPASNQLVIDVDLKYNTSLNYSIFDLNGRIVLSAHMNSAKETVNVSSLAPGNYLLKLSDNNRKTLYAKNISISR